MIPILLFLTHHNYVGILIRILCDAQRHLSCRICFCINLSLGYLVKFDKDLLDELKGLFQGEKIDRDGDGVGERATYILSGGKVTQRTRTFLHIVQS